jgi:ABC-2 type transport system permease protein
MLLPWVAFIASAGRGYLPPIGWAFLTLALAQIAAILGLGDWFPWAIPALFSGSLGPRADHLALHSYVAQSITLLAGLSATFAWWQTADQSR